jgi:hypothetical protein
MSFEMLQALVEQRRHEGASPEAIRAELQRMSLHPADIDRLVMAEPPKQLKAREDLTIFDFLAIIPLWLAPLAMLVMFAVFEKTTLAYGLLIEGLILTLICRVGIVLLAFSEAGIGAIFLFFFPCIAEIMLLLFRFQKMWKIVACGFMGGVCVFVAALVDPVLVGKLIGAKPN